MFDDTNWYQKIGIVIGICVFIVIYIYSIITYGLFGIALGWIPAVIGAGFSGTLWPITLIGLFFLFYQINQ